MPALPFFLRKGPVDAAPRQRCSFSDHLPRGCLQNAAAGLYAGGTTFNFVSRIRGCLRQAKVELNLQPGRFIRFQDAHKGGQVTKDRG